MQCTSIISFDYIRRSVTTKDEVLSAAARRNMFLAPDALEIIMSNSDPEAFAQTVLSSLANNPIFVTKDDVIGFLEGDKRIPSSAKPVDPHNKKNLEIKVLEGTDITGNSTCVGDINDFLRYFQNRFATLKRIIERRRDFGGMSKQIKDCSKTYDREFRIIGIVNERRVTSNGHIILNIEDDGGTRDSNCTVFISKDSEFFNEIITNDMVLGFKGIFSKPKSKDSRGMFIAREVFKPSVPPRAWQPSDSQSMLAFLSDVHIGSYTFLEKNWNRMIQYLKENSEEMQINYIVLPGDVVDGIGIFPGQEEELNISDIYDQYKALSEYLKDIPDHIQMVIHPGNHDACRPAEPQPALNKVFIQDFDSNVIMTGNPVYLRVEGRTVLTYHGRSIDDWVAGVQQLTYNDPLRVMKEMVDARHLAPIYGQKTALAPERKDFMAMDVVPDIFVSGHVHGYGYMEYKGIRLINASTWQNQTEYQKQHNFNPIPGIMPLVHLGTGKVSMKNFMKE